jgi:diguanylate cyclase (GGDEF)-like protein
MIASIIRKNIVSVIIAILIFAGFNAMLLIPLQPVGTPLDTWMVTYNNHTYPKTVPFCEELNPGVNTMTLTTTFASSDGDTLILPRIDGNAVEVKLNGEVIHRTGDLKEPTANLWNGHLTIPFTRPLKPVNDLEITIASSVVSIGLDAVPSIAPYPAAILHSTHLQWVFPNLILITTGMADILGLLLILFCLLRKDNRRGEFYIGLALILSTIFNLDMTYRETTGTLLTFLWFEKFVVIAGYFATAFLISGVETRIHSRVILRNWAFGFSAIISAVLLLTPDLYWFNKINGYLSYLICAVLIAQSVLIFVSRSASPFFLAATTFIALSVLQMGSSVVFTTPDPIFLPYTISLTAIFTGVDMVLNFNFLVRENQKLKVISKIDPLTKVLNRRGLNLIDVNKYQFIVMVDLDDFKFLNDRYGHSMGDDYLVRFSLIARENLRPDDLVVRWGGDEFLLAFTGIPRGEKGNKAVEKIMSRILKEYSSSGNNPEFTFSYGIASLEISFDRSLKEADARMYEMKNKRKRLDL